MRDRSAAAFVVVAGLAVAIAGAVRGDEVSLSPVADTCLFEFDPDYNFGSDDTIPVGALGTMAGGARARGLMRFDVAAAVPAGSTITGAALTIRVTQEPSNARSSTWSLYAAYQDWGEGTGSGSGAGGRPALEGEATWNARFHGGETWDEPGGEIGGDFAEDPAASQAVTGPGTFRFAFNATGLADLQAMLDTPAQNFGWALATEAEGTVFTAKHFATREHANPPVLEIEYSPPQSLAPPEILTFALDVPGSTGSLTFFRAAGLIHRLQSSASPGSDAWTTMAELPPAPQDGEGSFDFAVPAGDRRFWRIEAERPAAP